MTIPFLQAKFFQVASRTAIDWIVWHVAEVTESAQSAEWLMDYCTKIEPTRKASWHYAIDNDSYTQSVLEKDIAYHCGHTGNQRSLGFEMSGFSNQSAAQWADPYSLAVLDNCTKLTASRCARYNIPIVFLKAADIVAGKRGITTHAEMSLAFKETQHTDPGPNFPIELAMSSVWKWADPLHV